MKVYSTIEELKNDGYLNNSTSIGFVPTMGALHNGHLSLITKASSENNVVVCSVFVNPKQFNNAADLSVYPRNLELDIELLKNVNCHILFAPSVNEVYPNSDFTVEKSADLGNISKTMEGAFRPGHFDGVVAVVKRLFEIVKPTSAYFGEKDFQQLCVVKALTLKYNFNINIIGCPIIREDDGLAMSSRNINLSATERIVAASIPKIMNEAKLIAINSGLELAKNWVYAEVSKISIAKLEYFEFADETKLEFADEITTNKIRAFIAVNIGKTRLIDNIEIN